MSSTKQRKRLNNFDVHETLYQINLSFEDYKYSNILICVFWKCRVWWNSHSWFHAALGWLLIPFSTICSVSYPRTVPCATVMFLVR